MIVEDLRNIARSLLLSSEDLVVDAHAVALLLLIEELEEEFMNKKVKKKEETKKPMPPMGKPVDLIKKKKK